MASPKSPLGAMRRVGIHARAVEAAIVYHPRVRLAIVWSLGLVVACGAHSSTKPAGDTSAGMVIPPMSSAPTPPRSPPPVVSHVPNDIHDHPELIGQEIDLDVYEPIRDMTMSSGAGPGEYDVDVEDVGSWRFKIAPAEGTTLPSDLKSPIHVRGVATKTAHGVAFLTKRVDSLPFPAPTRVTDLKGIRERPDEWAGRYVEVEGTWTVGFEHSSIGEGIWVSGYPDMDVRCAPSANINEREDPVRMTGFLYTKSGHYGHLGMARAKLVATAVIYLDPKRPECR